MAESDSTLRTRFALRKFVVKTHFITLPAFLLPGASEPTGLNLKPDSGFKLHSLSLVEPSGDVLHSVSGNVTEDFSGLSLSALLNDTLPSTLETLRSHVDVLLRLPLSVGEKNRLMLKVWAMECRLEAVRVLLVEAGDLEGFDAACLDLSCLDLSGFTVSGFDWVGLG